jgi:hypothetical protein
MAKNPTPQKFDNVEMVDNTKVDGYVKEIIDNKTVLVSWFIDNDYNDKGEIVKENRIDENVLIKKLALTKR